MREKIISAQLSHEAEALVDKYRERICILLAGGRSVWQDFKDFACGWHSDFDIMCVNDVGMFWPNHLEHWFSLHGDQFSGWCAVREFHYKPAKYLHACAPNNRAIVWPVPQGGTSTMSAVYTALVMGYKQVVMCGAPFSDDGHFFDPLDRTSNFKHEALPERWIRARDTIFEGKVKSMSGLSREILGAP